MRSSAPQKNKEIQKNQDGFVALMTVMTVSLLVGGFLVFASPRLILQNQSVMRTRFLAEARLDAYSCIEVARLVLFERSEAVEVNEIEGKYDASHERCRIDSVESERWNGDEAWVVQTTGFSTQHPYFARLEARLALLENEEPRLDVVSVREF